MKFRIEFDLENAQFDCDKTTEIGKILERYAHYISVSKTVYEMAKHKVKVFDDNGNTIGSFRVMDGKAAK